MNLKTIAFWGMLALIIALGIYLIVYIKTESFQCLSNPYNYSMALLEKSNNAEITCTCSGSNPQMASFIWNTKGFQPFNSRNAYDFNLS